MKRISKVLAVMVLVALSLFVSCNNEPALPDGTATVKFVGSADEGNARSLTKTNPVFEPDKYIWKYEAVKKDSSGLSTGATTEKTLVGTDGSINNSVGPFSLGDWEFRLYAYTTKDHADNDEYAYAGTVNAKITSGATNTIGVTVKAFSTGADGYIQFPSAGDITLQDEDENPINESEYEEKITITDANTDTPLEGLVMTDRTYTVPSGFYEVTVQYHKKGDATLVYGESTIFVNVWDYLTTKIGGSLDEIRNDVSFDVDSENAVTETVAEASDLEMTVNTSPVAGESTNTTVLIPSVVLSGHVGDKAVLTVYSLAEEETEGFQIADDESFMGGIDLKLTIGGESVTSFSNPVTVTTYVAKGLSNVKVKYNGTGEQPTFVSYDSASGKLVFTTTHFSEFYVTSDSVAYIPETNTAYSSLKEAIDAVREGETVKLIRDAKESCITIGENKEVLLDLNGNTYTLNSVQDSSEIKSSIKISSGSSVKIIGTGLIKVQNDDSSITDVMLPSGARNKNYIIYVGNNSSLTIEDDVVIGGLLDSPSSRAIYVDKNASLNINGGLIRTFSANGGSTIYNDGNAFINGGTILSGCFAIGSDAGNLTITDGVMASVASNLFEDANNKSYYAYAVRCGGTFEMTGGDVYGVQGGISATNGTATFSGTAHGETTYEIFDKIRQASDDETADAYMEYYKANARKSEATIGASELYYGMYVAGEHGKVEPVKIYGGTYISGSKVAMLVGNSQDGGLGEFAGVSVYGGTFKGINGAVKVDGGSEADGYGKGSLKLYGGRYSSTANMENCLAEGYAVSVNPDIEGFYEVFEIGFAGGNGTEDNPYLISDVAQFMILDNDNIELSGKYLKLNNDISIPADTFITNTVDYYLDGNGHKIELTGTAPSDLTTYSTFSIFETLGNGSFSNIDFHTKGFKALSQSLSEDCSFTFSAVDVYGDMSGGDSNVGAYVVFVGANSSLKFDGCDSYVNITDNQGGSHYGAPFVGGYLMYNSSKPVGERTPKSVEFTDCNNHGDVFFGKWAALLIGNPSNYDKFVGEGKSINYSNCHNYGTISAIEKVGIVTCNDTTSFDSVNAGDGSFIVFDDSEYIKSFIVSSSDGTVRLETENIPEDATIEYGVVVYCSYPEGVTGTRRITFTIDISDYNNKLPVKAFYDADGSYYNGEVVETDGVYLIYCNPDSYEMGPNGNVSSKVDYCVIIKSDNKIIASKYAELS